MSYDVHQVVTDKIVAAIEAGNLAPWHRPWSKVPRSPGSASVCAPVNVTSGREYNGINVLTLWAASQCHGYPTGGWLTRKQAEDMGGTLRAGEGKKYEPIVWSQRKTYDTDRDGSAIVDKDGNPDTRSVWLTKYSFVYNVAAFDGLPAKLTGSAPVALPGDERFAGARAIVAGAAVAVDHGGERACYSPGLNRIKMPVPAAFEAPDAYWATLLHELTHATGHATRLDRDLTGSFGSGRYAAEELIAELGAAFACARLGIDSEPREDHASYLAHWMGVLKADKKAIFIAAAKASAAAKWLYRAGGIDSTATEEVQAAAK